MATTLQNQGNSNSKPPRLNWKRLGLIIGAVLPVLSLLGYLFSHEVDVAAQTVIIKDHKELHEKLDKQKEEIHELGTQVAKITHQFQGKVDTLVRKVKSLEIDNSQLKKEAARSDSARIVAEKRSKDMQDSYDGKVAAIESHNNRVVTAIRLSERTWKARAEEAERGKAAAEQGRISDAIAAERRRKEDSTALASKFLEAEQKFLQSTKDLELKYSQLGAGFSDLARALKLSSAALERNAVGFYKIPKAKRHAMIGDAIRLFRNAEAKGALPAELRPTVQDLEKRYYY